MNVLWLMAPLVLVAGASYWLILVRRLGRERSDIDVEVSALEKIAQQAHEVGVAAERLRARDRRLRDQRDLSGSIVSR